MQLEPCRDVYVGDVGVGCIIFVWHVSCVKCAVPLHQSKFKGGGADMNLRGSNSNIRARGQIGRGGWWGREQKV